MAVPTTSVSTDRRLVFTSHAWADYTYWVNEDRTILKRLNRVLLDVLRDPFEGIGKPERLSHSLSGAWSRRIDQEHRLVSLLDGLDIVILQARYHYEP
jgi:toxin YoeB